MTRLPYWEQEIFRLLYIAQRPIYGLDITEMPKIEIYDRREPFPQQGYYWDRTMKFGIDPTSPRALDDAFAIASHEFGHHLQNLAESSTGGRDVPTVYVREQARLKELLPDWEHHPIEVEAEETRRIIQPRLASAQTRILPSVPLALAELPYEERAKQALYAQSEAIAALGKGRVVTEWETYRLLETRAKSGLIEPIVIRSDIAEAVRSGVIEQHQADTLLALLSGREEQEREGRRRREVQEQEERRRMEERERKRRAEEQERLAGLERERRERERKANVFSFLLARAESSLIAPAVVRVDINAALRENDITHSQAQTLFATLQVREQRRREEEEEEQRIRRAAAIPKAARPSGYRDLLLDARVSTPNTFEAVRAAIFEARAAGRITVQEQGELLAMVDARQFR